VAGKMTRFPPFHDQQKFPFADHEKKSLFVFEILKFLVIFIEGFKVLNSQKKK